MTQQEIESIGFELLEWNKILEEKYYKKSIGRLWIYLTEVPFSKHTVYTIEVSPLEDAPKTIVVHSIRLYTIEELKTLLNQLNINE